LFSEFLVTNLESSKTYTPEKKGGENPLPGLRISRDPDTGESFLKISLPQPETVKKIVSALSGVLGKPAD
jgi:hypothetical protein